MVASLHCDYTVFYVLVLSKSYSGQASCNCDCTVYLLYITHRVVVKMCVGLVVKIGKFSCTNA